MLKRNKSLLILTSAIILLPMIAGLILWSALPEKIPTHWNAAGQIDGWSGKGFAVFGVPAFMLGVHWICTFFTAADPKNKGHNEKSMGLVLWICPVMSVLVGVLMFCAAFGVEVRVERIMPVILGLMFVIFGNFMPKFKQNHTMGIKLPWTLSDEENWNKTHRMAGKLWVIGGLAMMVGGFFDWMVVLLVVLIVLAMVPMAYSYWMYRKRAGKA